MRALSFERAAEAAAYIFLRWRYDPKTGVVSGRGGKPIGSKRKDGALQALVYIPSGKTSVLIHRAAYLLKTGAWPRHEIDHENGIRSDNRWRNIRPATRGQNRQNLSKRNGKGRLIGCTPHKGQWKGQIKVDGVQHYLGLFPTEEKCHAAYCEAKQRLHLFNPTPR